TCSECQYHFFVGDEYAGRPGRCPECGAVIHVPEVNGPQPTPPPAEPDPYRASRHDEAFDDEFPSRRRRRDDDRERHEDQQRADYDDRPRRFDPHARARAWQRVYRGLGFIQIAVVTGFLSQILQGVLVAARGGPNAPQNVPWNSGMMATAIGSVLLVFAGGLFWLIGRVGGARVPYVPARGWGRASLFLVLASVGAMPFCCCFMLAAEEAKAQAGGAPKPEDTLIVLLFAASFLLFCVLLIGAEVTALVSMARIGDGLKAHGAAASARVSIAVLFAVLGLLVVGTCVLFLYVTEKQMQQVQNQAPPAAPANQANDAGPPAKAKDAAPGPPANDKAGGKDKGKPKGKDAGPPPQPANGPPPPPNPPDAETAFIAVGVLFGLLLIYLIHFSVSLQRVRRAIRREIDVLTGNEQRQDDQPY
ncbi:MAG TPA: hypothetical protein VKE40_27685, partial [Gemmataceae bacterium]|nr:hypothetical protein [Gemmataceae bacterium]